LIIERKTYIINNLLTFQDGVINIFIDEQAYNISEGRRYSWGLKGMKIKIQRPRKQKKFTLLLGISERGSEGFIIIEGSATKELYNYFFFKIIDRLR